MTAGIRLSVGLLLAAAAAARADTVELANGNLIEGTIVSQNASEVVVDIGYGTMSLRRTEIAKILRTPRERRKGEERELSRRRFESGRQVPRGAEELDHLMRGALAQREKAFDAKSRRAELEAEIQMSTSSARIEEAGKEARSAGAEIGRYFDGYRRLQEYLKGAGAALAAAGRKGPDRGYYAWVDQESRQMRRDFVEDTVKSEDQGGGAVVVTAVVNGRSLHMLVDATAELTTLYGAAAAAFGVEAKDELGTVLTVVAYEHKVEGKRVRLSSVKVGASEAAGSEAVVVLPDGQPPFDGLLGMSFLSRFVFHVDPKGGKLVLERLK